MLSGQVVFPIRWIAENVLPYNRWYPVMQRYIEQLAGRVQGFGGDPAKIPPSQTGSIPSHPVHPQPGHGGTAPGQGKLEHRHETTGKLAGIVYDHFGDFSGFIVQTEHGEEHHFRSREEHVQRLVRLAYDERIRITVVHDPHRHNAPLSIIMRGPPPFDPC
jgi:hypothetical protein